GRGQGWRVGRGAGAGAQGGEGGRPPGPDRGPGGPSTGRGLLGTAGSPASGGCEPRRSLLLDDDPTLGVHEHSIAASVPARDDVVVVALLGGGDDLPAPLSL